jgi:hypothetical protein
VGPDFVTVGALTGLPAGQHVISAKVQLSVGDATTGTATCFLLAIDVSGTVELDSSAATVPTSSVGTVPLAGVTSLASGGDVSLGCSADTDTIDASNIKLSAIQVDALTVQP